MVLFEFVSLSAPASAALSKSGRWLTYNGNYPYLVGYDLQQLFAQKSYTDADMDYKLNQLKEFGVSAIRVWSNNWFMGDNGYYPWARDGAGKFNLTAWDQTYWDRMKRFVQKCKDRDIIVEFSIFCEYPGNVNYWTSTNFRNAYYKNFNSNGAFSLNAQGNFYPQYFDLNYQENGIYLKNIQQALVDKSINELNPLGNVFFLVHNEFPAMWCNGDCIDDVYQWQQHWANYIKSKGAIVAAQTNEGSGLNTYGIQYFKDQPYIDSLIFHYYSSGLNNIDTIGNFFHDLQRGGKILMCDESHAYENTTHTNTATREAWASFVSGAYYLHYQDTPDIIGNSAWRTNAERIKVLRNVSESVNFWQMSPVDAGGNEYDSLISQAPASYWQVLANPGNEYVAYFSASPTSAAVRITLPAGNYDYKFYDTRTWNINGVASGTVTGTGSAVNINAPSPGSWNGETGLALVIKKKADTTAPGSPSGLSVR